jgi:pimeloyl-ACP methyl ester carboxylesterase
MVDGEPLATFRRGSGSTPVLMLHGFLGSGRNLASLAQRLSETDPALSITVCDLLGHGASAKLPPVLTFAAVSAPVVSLLNSSPVPVVLIGHSLGGRVALHAAAACPSKVRGCILLDAAPGPVGDRGALLEQVTAVLLGAPATVQRREEMHIWLTSSGLTPALADWLCTNLRSEPGGSLGWRFDRAALAKLGRLSQGNDLWSEAVALGPRLALISGGASGFVQEQDRRRAHAGGSFSEVIAGAGHFLHVDQPALLTEAITRALQSFNIPR